MSERLGQLCMMVEGWYSEWMAEVECRREKCCCLGARQASRCCAAYMGRRLKLRSTQWDLGQAEFGSVWYGCGMADKCLR
jgi:hypothetical protein